MKFSYLSLLVLLVTSCSRQENSPKSDIHVPSTSEVRLSQDIAGKTPTVEREATDKNTAGDQVVVEKTVVQTAAALESVLHDSNVPPEVLILDPASIALQKVHSRPHEASNGAWGECNLVINVLALVTVERDNGLPSSVSERNVAKILVDAEATGAEVLDWISAARAVHASSVVSQSVLDVLGDQCGKLTKGAAR